MPISEQIKSLLEKIERIELQKAKEITSHGIKRCQYFIDKLKKKIKELEND